MMKLYACAVAAQKRNTSTVECRAIVVLASGDNNAKEQALAIAKQQVYPLHMGHTASICEVPLHMLRAAAAQ